MTFQIKSEEYYKVFIELQEKLRKSEEERLKLEMKFNEMFKKSRDEEHAYFKKLHVKYKKFIVEDKKRQQRNEGLLRLLERIDTKLEMIAAKTERIGVLRMECYNVFTRGTSRHPNINHRNNLRVPITSSKPSEIFLTGGNDYSPADNDPLLNSRTVDNLKIQRPRYKTSVNRYSPEENDLLLNSRIEDNNKVQLRHKIVQDKKLIKDDRKPVNKYNYNTDYINSNEANLVADDIINSVYYRYYNKHRSLNDRQLELSSSNNSECMDSGADDIERNKSFLKRDIVDRGQKTISSRNLKETAIKENLKMSDECISNISEAYISNISGEIEKSKDYIQSSDREAFVENSSVENLEDNDVNNKKQTNNEDNVANLEITEVSQEVSINAQGVQPNKDLSEPINQTREPNRIYDNGLINNSNENYNLTEQLFQDANKHTEENNDSVLMSNGNKIEENYVEDINIINEEAVEDKKHNLENTACADNTIDTNLQQEKLDNLTQQFDNGVSINDPQGENMDNSNKGLVNEDTMLDSQEIKTDDIGFENSSVTEYGESKVQDVQEYNSNLQQEYDENAYYDQQYEGNNTTSQEFNEMMSYDQIQAYQPDENNLYLQEHNENIQYMEGYDENGVYMQYSTEGQQIQYDENQPYDENNQSYLQSYDQNQSYDQFGNPVHYDEYGQIIQEYGNTNLDTYAESNENENTTGNIEENIVNESTFENIQDNYVNENSTGHIEANTINEISAIARGNIEDNFVTEDTIKNEEDLIVNDVHNKEYDVMQILDTDSESTKENTKLSNNSDFDFSTN